MNKQKGLAPILIVILIALVIGGYLIYQKQVKPVVISEVSFITNFDECIKSSGSKVIDGYPKICESSEKKTYVEEIKGVVDTNNWQEVNTKSGFSFKCPPKWTCGEKDQEDILHGGYVASAYSSGYVGYSLGFGIIRAADFQQSVYRHPNYRNGVDWFNDLLAKNPKSIEVLPSTIKQGKPGTDEQVAPLYYGFKLDEMQELEIDHQKALHTQEKAYVTNRVLVPLNDRDLLFIEKGQANSAAPLGEAIILSIKFSSPK